MQYEMKTVSCKHKARAIRNQSDILEIAIANECPRFMASVEA